MSVNLKELSARLGLSPTTVSRALGGYSDVSPATKERVQAMARELGYQPNRAARQIALGRADAVGIVYPLDPDLLGNPAFLDVLAGVSQSLEGHGLDLLLLAAPPGDEAEMQTYERMVRGRRVDAAVVALTRAADPRIEYLLEAGLPFVAYGRSREPDRYPWFDFDNCAGGRLAVERLAALGHRRIVCVHTPLDMNFARQRYDGHLQGLQMAGLPIDDRALIDGGMHRRTGYAAGLHLLTLDPRPTAVVVHHNLTGVGVIRALLDAGVAVGSEISVLVYDGVPPDTLLRGLQVAAIQQPTARDSGRKIGEMVLDLIQGRPLADRGVLRQPVFVAGDSVAPPPA
jgi:LacI family transcriptional regulator